MNTAPATKPLRVLIVSEMSLPYTVGGGETRYALLAKQLAGLGHQVRWLSMHQKGSPAKEVIDGVEHWHVGPRLLAPPVRSLGAKLWFMASLVAHLVRHRYDIVDCQTYAPLPAAWWACRLLRMPMVATIHDTAASGPASDQWLSGFDRRLAGLVERRLYRLGYDQVLTVSEAVKADLLQRFGLPDARVAVVLNRIDVEAMAATPPAPDACDLVFVGRLVPHKHPEDLLQALAALNRDRRQRGLRPWRAKLVGGGPLAESLRQQAQAWGVTPDCSFCGELPAHSDVVAHIRSARILVLPSTREGFGLVLAEAMAAGLAVVAYDIPAVRQTLGQDLGPHGLVPVSQVQALTDALRRLLEDEPLRAHCAALGQARVAAHFDQRGFAGQVLGVYRQTIARKRSPPAATTG